MTRSSPEYAERTRRQTHPTTPNGESRILMKVPSSDSNLKRTGKALGSSLLVGGGAMFIAFCVMLFLTHGNWQASLPFGLIALFVCTCISYFFCLLSLLDADEKKLQVTIETNKEASMAAAAARNRMEVERVRTKARTISSNLFLSVRQRGTGELYLASERPDFTLAIFNARPPTTPSDLGELSRPTLKTPGELGQFDLPTMKGGVIDIVFGSGQLAFTAYRCSDKSEYVMKFDAGVGIGKRQEITFSELRVVDIFLLGNVLVVVRNNLDDAYADIVMAGIESLHWLETLRASAVVAQAGAPSAPETVHA